MKHEKALYEARFKLTHGISKCRAGFTISHPREGFKGVVDAVKAWLFKTPIIMLDSPLIITYTCKERKPKKKKAELSMGIRTINFKGQRIYDDN